MDERHNPDGSIKPEFYDPRERQDHSGLRFQAVGRSSNLWNRMIQDLMLRPTKFQCPECGCDRLYVIADDHPETSYMALQCSNPRCRTGFPVVELHKPQLGDAVAKKLGLYVPDGSLNLTDLGALTDEELRMG